MLIYIDDFKVDMNLKTDIYISNSSRENYKNNLFYISELTILSFIIYINNSIKIRTVKRWKTVRPTCEYLKKNCGVQKKA